MKESLCSSCKHHTGRQSVDDVPDECYTCVWEQSRTGHFINYQPDLGKLLHKKLQAPEVTPEEEEEWMRKEIKMTVIKDNVNSPGHYTQGGIETIDFIVAKLGRDGAIAYCLGNVMKYVTRWKDKNGLEDLKKALWYLTYATKLIEAK